MLQAAQDAGDVAAVTTRQLPAHDARLHCVDLADQFAAAGAKSGAVQTFDFSGAAAAAERSQVGKLACQAWSSIAGGLLRLTWRPWALPQTDKHHALMSWPAC